jgi:hypothetical protein
MERIGRNGDRVTIDWDRLQLAYDWAKEWQILLAGVLVFFAALIVAWANIRAAKLGSSARLDAKTRSQADLRLASPAAGVAPNPASNAVHAAAQSGELISTLEQLRSLIRSALAALPAPGEKENNPTPFICQRILHLRLEAMPPSAHMGKAAHDDYAALLKQLTVLRSDLKKAAPPAEMSEILVQINGSARNLIAALIPASEKRRQAVQDLR